MSEIVRYSQIPQNIRILVDNFNDDTQQSVLLHEIKFQPVYRVFCRDKGFVYPVGEKYFLDEISANKYWSDLMCAKRYLF